MGKELSNSVFDYSQVDKDAKGKLIALAGQLKRHGDALRNAGNEIGNAVIEAHSILSASRAGLFDEWVESETEIGLSTAYNCLNAAKRAVNFPIIGKLPPTVAYMLSGPKVPDEAIKDFEKQVGKGVKPTIANAKATLDRFREVATKSNGKPPQPATASVSDKGKTGGGNPASSSTGVPASPGPASGEAADFGTCPNCGGKKWTEDEFGASCAKCNHPHGEPVGDQDEDRIGTQRAKTVKTVEALMRAFDDLNRMLSRPEHVEAMASCKFLLKTARAWK